MIHFLTKGIFWSWITLQISAQLTDPSQLPDYNDLASCAINALTRDDILGCASWKCVCNDFGPAMSFVSSKAAAGCNNDPQLVAGATNILDEFCAQITVTPTNRAPTAPAGHTTLVETGHLL